jgi:Spy/CpxP family protein refolding chaperone
MKLSIGKVLTLFTLAGAVALVPAATAFAQDAQPQAQGPHAKHHRGHQKSLLGAALKLDTLTPAQRTSIEQLIAARRAASVPVRQADAQVLTVLAQQVEQAKSNPQAVFPSLAAERSAALAELQVDQSTLAQLHSILTPAQRGQLVDSVEARMAQGRQGWEGKGKGGGGKLGLSPQQKADIKANLQASRPQGQPQGQRGQMHAALESFRGDSFDMNGLARVEHRGDREARTAAAMIPVLTPNQRTTFATQLRNRAAREGRS